MAEKRKSSPDQLSLRDLHLKQLLSNYNEQLSKNSAVLDGFRELGIKISELNVNHFPSRTQPLLPEVVRVYNNVEYTMRMKLDELTNLLMNFVFKARQVYVCNQEVDKKELVQIKMQIDQEILKKLSTFVEDVKNKFFAIFHKLLIFGRREIYKTLLNKKEKLEIEIKDFSNNILSLTKKLRQEEGE